jgi:hypothetical protein
VGAANVFGFILDQNGNSAAAVNLQGGSRTVLAPIVEPVPPGTSQVRSSLHGLNRTLGFGTGRKRMALERRTTPNRSRRACSPRYGLQPGSMDWASRSWAPGAVSH